MFKTGDRVVVVKNLLGGPDTGLFQRGEVMSVQDTALGVEVRTKDYGPLNFMVEELEFEEAYDIMSAPPADEDSTEDSKLVRRGEMIYTENRGEDMVAHPSHYTSHPSGVECIEITKHYNFPIGSAMKYLWRAGLKDEDTKVQDLQKAIKFIEFEIERLGGTV